MVNIFSPVITTFFVALGVMLGGAVVGGIGAFLINQPPLSSMAAIGERIKIWALFVALGDSFSTIRNLEQGFLGGRPESVAKQLIIIFSAFAGSHLGYLTILFLAEVRGR